MGAVTTASSPLVTCRHAPLNCRSMGPACLCTGPSSAMFLSDQRFLQYVSGKIAFRTAQAHTTARVGTRRRIHGGCNAWRPATGSFRVCLPYLFDRWHREVMLQLKSSIGRSESPS